MVREQSRQLQRPPAFLRGATPFVELRRVAAGLRPGLAAPTDSDVLFREGTGVAITAKPLHINPKPPKMFDFFFLL